MKISKEKKGHNFK